MKYLYYTSYDQQTKLEKEIKIKEEVYAALMSKGLNNYFKKTIEVEAVKPVSIHLITTHFCGASGCYSNSDTTCTLPKSHDQEDFKKCKAMGGRETCK